MQAPAPPPAPAGAGDSHSSSSAKALAFSSACNIPPASSASASGARSCPSPPPRSPTAPPPAAAPAAAPAAHGTWLGSAAAAAAGAAGGGGASGKPSGKPSGKGKAKEYTAKPGTAAFALLVGLYRLEQGVGTEVQEDVTKEALAAFAQTWSDQPIIPKAPPPGRGGAFGGGPQFSYAGWSCMKKTLVEKQKLIETGKVSPTSFPLSSPPPPALSRRLFPG